MPKKLQIFVPEYVPLANKGEEAIIRGMGDVIFPNEQVEFHILDLYSNQPKYVDGIHVYPWRWFYPAWRSKGFNLGTTPKEIWSSACSVLRHGLNRFFPLWVRIPQATVSKNTTLLRQFQSGQAPWDRRTRALRTIMDADLMIAGHDGAFNEYECHVINMMINTGMPYGIFGNGVGLNIASKAIHELFVNTLSRAKFIYCRDLITTDWARSQFSNLQVELAPDPAFGMFSVSEEKISAIIDSEGLGSFFSKPVIMVTATENPVVGRFSYRNELTRKRKLVRHRKLFVSLIQHIVQNYGVNLLFLPHSIGPEVSLDDRRVAREIIAEIPQLSSGVKVLETEYSARELKGLIGRAELLIGERTHSIIAAVGVHVPFMCLGVQQDRRTRSIIGDMCECNDVIYYLDNPDEKKLQAHFDYVWRRRSELRSRLEIVSDKIERKLQKVGKAIWNTLC